MKKLILLFTLIVFASSLLTAQIPNPDFEDWYWDNHPAYEPVGWQTLNSNDLTNVTQSEISYSGSYAAKLSVEWDSGLNMYISPMCFVLDNFPISERYTSLSVYVQGTALGSDSMFVSVGMWKGGEMIGFGLRGTTETYSGWTEYVIPIDYAENDEVPDEGYISLYIKPTMNGSYGTYYIFDHLAFTGGGGNTIPLITSASTNIEGTTVEMTFNVAMSDPSGTENQFSVNINGTAADIENVHLKAGNSAIILLDLNEQILYGDAITVSYTAGTVTSEEGEPLESFSDFPITNMTGGGGEYGWNLINSGTSLDLNDVHFVSTNSGYIAGNEGLTMSTTNGGQNWSIKTIPSWFNFFCIYATTADDVYIGVWDSIYTSHNGGITYSPIVADLTNYNINEIQFINSNTGFGFAEVSTFIKTTDGGNSWNNIGGAGAIENFLGGYMLDETTGYAVGNCGLITKTIDGGLNWVIYGWDDWATWSCIDIFDVYFTSPNNGIAVADSGTIFKTSNAGTDWTRYVIAGETDAFKSISFVNELTGFIAGSNGKIFKTTDGGENWNFEVQQTNNDLNSIFFLDENHGWAVGNNGTILLYGFIAGIEKNDMSTASFISAFPNPAHNQTTLKIQMDVVSVVNIALFQSDGRKVKDIYQGNLRTGENFININLKELPHGLYLCVVRRDNWQKTIKIIVKD